MKLLIITLIFLGLITAFLPYASPALAQTGIGIDRSKIPPGLTAPGKDASASMLSTIIRNLVTLFYSIGALGFTIMVIWGSVNWILSGGDKEKISGARKKITTALMGMFILALSFPIIAIIAQITGVDILGNLPLNRLTKP